MKHTILICGYGPGISRAVARQAHCVIFGGAAPFSQGVHHV